MLFNGDVHVTVFCVNYTWFYYAVLMVLVGGREALAGVV